MRPYSPRLTRTRALFLAFVTSCSAVSPDSSKDWKIATTADRASVTIVQGTTGIVHLTTTRSGGFTGALTYSFSPSGTIAVSAANVVTTGAVTTADILIAVPGSYPPGPFPVSVRVGGTSDDVVQGNFVDVSLDIVRQQGIFVQTNVSLSVARGVSSGPVPITLIRTDVTGDVTMSLALGTNIPAGITATFAPNPVTGATATMTLSVASSVPEGAYNVGVRGNVGSFQGTAPLTLTVTPLATLGIAISPNPLTVVRGQTGAATATLTRTNVSALVGLQAAGVPPGVSVSFSTPGTSGDTIGMTFNTTQAAVAGTYTIQVSSTGPGVPTTTVPLTLVVVP